MLSVLRPKLTHQIYLQVRSNVGFKEKLPEMLGLPRAPDATPKSGSQLRNQDASLAKRQVVQGKQV
jgi:hypothetical protein